MGILAVNKLYRANVPLDMQGMRLIVVHLFHFATGGECENTVRGGSRYTVTIVDAHFIP